MQTARGAACICRIRLPICNPLHPYAFDNNSKRTAVLNISDQISEGDCVLQIIHSRPHPQHFSVLVGLEEDAERVWIHVESHLARHNDSAARALADAVNRHASAARSTFIQQILIPQVGVACGILAVITAVTIAGAVSRGNPAAKVNSVPRILRHPAILETRMQQLDTAWRTEAIALRHAITSRPTCLDHALLPCRHSVDGQAGSLLGSPIASADVKFHDPPEPGPPTGHDDGAAASRASTEAASDADDLEDEPNPSAAMSRVFSAQLLTVISAISPKRISDLNRQFKTSIGMSALARTIAATHGLLDQFSAIGNENERNEPCPQSTVCCCASIACPSHVAGAAATLTATLAGATAWYDATPAQIQMMVVASGAALTTVRFSSQKDCAMGRCNAFFSSLLLAIGPALSLFSGSVAMTKGSSEQVPR